MATMIKYKKCTEVNEDAMYEAFRIGFSDYIIKLEISKETFIKHFFGPEGNQVEHSFVALHDNEPIGIILGGIKTYEGLKTMRCGALAIHPDFRGKGISQHLFNLHKEEAIQQGCQQLFLEVIVGNDRAIQFYRKRSYDKVYDLSYYHLKDVSQLVGKNRVGIEVKQVQFEMFQAAIQQWLPFHLNWQNDIDYMEKTENNCYYAAYVDESLTGCLCVSTAGKISFLFIDSKLRNHGIATNLLQVACKQLQLSSLSIGFPNNSLLEGYLKKVGFEKSALSQYEMYCVL